MRFGVEMDSPEDVSKNLDLRLFKFISLSNKKERKTKKERNTQPKKQSNKQRNKGMQTFIF